MTWITTYRDRNEALPNSFGRLLSGFLCIICAISYLSANEDLSDVVTVLPPDRIPSIDTPLIAPLADEDGFDLREPLLVVILDDQARGYPLHLLMRHEIVNDVLSDIPLAATWCPLCDSAIVFDRRMEEEVLVFGVSGRLRNSNLIMFDREHGAFWQQANGAALTGPHVGQKLTAIPSRIMTGKALLKEFPNATLGMHPIRRSGSGGNAYPGYDAINGEPWPQFISNLPDTPVPPMTRVIAMPDGERWLAVADDPQGGVRQIPGESHSMVLVQRPGAPSAVDTQRIIDGRTLGDPVVFANILDGKILDLQAPDALAPTAAALVDQHGNHYDIHGRILSGPDRDSQRQLIRIPFRRYLAFAWYAFYHDTVWLDDAEP